MLRHTMMLCSTILLLLAGVAVVSGEAPSRRILIIVEADSGQPATIEMTAGLRTSFNADRSTNFEIYTEYLDSARFPGPENLDRMSGVLIDKYRSMKLDAAIALGPTALDFLVAHHADIAPGAPLFFGAVADHTAKRFAATTDVRGVTSNFDVKRTMELARELQPTATEAVVLTGSAPFDRSWLETAKAALGDRFAGFHIRYVCGLSADSFASYVAELPANTAVLLLTVYQDAAGHKFVPRDAAAIIAGRSAAPVYSVYDTFLDRGILGGYMGTFSDAGAQLGDMVRKQLSGDTDMPSTESSIARPIVDWRQIERFGIRSSLVPADAEIRFREPTIWDKYRTEILLTLTLVVSLKATIIGLILQGRRRKAVEAELATGRIELAHLSRASLLGELSGAFAHELNQPLTSILANAQVARRLIADGKAGAEDLDEILADIETDDRRAASVIAQLRRLLVKGDTSLEPTDLNRVASATLQLLGSDLVAKQIKVEFVPSRVPVSVMANFAQLQQVVLNLVVNAVDAMRDVKASERHVSVAVRKRGKWGDLIVSDNGNGLTKDFMEEAFKPFVSTKPKGLGLGLSICRSIAKAHGGSLGFDGEQVAGARIILSLPLEGHAHEGRRISGPFGG